MKVTIGIPFYNSEKTLDLAVESVLNQTYKDWELFLIDDGSTDNSVSIALNKEKKDSRIKLFQDGINKGLVNRLNQIITLANGKYIARMDADDIMMPNRLEKQIAVFNNLSDVDIVCSAVFTIDENNIPIGIRDTHKIDLTNPKIVFKKSILVHPTIMVKKEWYHVNRYDANYIRAEDYELWCRTYRNTVFYRINEPLLMYREGKINVHNYRLSMKTLRKIHFNYSRFHLSFWEYYFEIIKTHIKSSIYLIADFCNMQQYLSAMRNNKISKIDFEYLVKYINSLKTSSIDGFFK